MGKAVKQVGGFLGLGNSGSSSAGPRLDFDRIDAREDVKQRTQPAREASLKLLTDLQEQAAGRGPSLAGEQLKSATSRSLAQTLAAASAARGGSPALQQRELLRAQGDANRQLAEASAQARMQEQLAARNQLADLAVQQQAQDLSQVIQPTQILAGGEQARFAADVARRNSVKEQQNALMGQLFQAGASAAAAGLGGSDENNKVPLDGKGKTGAASSFFSSLANSQKKKNASMNERTSSGMGVASKVNPDFASQVARFSGAAPTDYGNAGSDLASAIGGLLTRKPTAAPTDDVYGPNRPKIMPLDFGSDEKNKKTSKVNPKKDMKDFLDKVEARSYVYKNPDAPGAAPGKRYGIMAQDLEKSEVGKTLVKDTPNGKMVDTVQGFGAVLAAQSELNERLKKLESYAKNKKKA